MKKRIVWLASHPVHYRIPIYKEMSKFNDIAFKVLFYSDYGIGTHNEKEFAAKVDFGVSLLEGYEYKVLEKSSSEENTSSMNKLSFSRLKKILIEENVDAIIVQGWNNVQTIKAIYVANQIGIKVFMQGEATDHFISSMGVKRILRDLFLKNLLKKMNGFFAIGYQNTQFYLRRGIRSNQMSPALYCVDDKFFEMELSTSELDQTRRNIGIDSKLPVILYVGKLSERKRVGDLLSAYFNLKEPRPYLLIAGSGEQESNLRKLSIEKNLSRVIFLGFKNQRELVNLYRIADIFVLPSVRETWGLVINEAMHSSCAIITNDQVGSAYDLVKNDINGYVYRAGEIADLTEAITNCLFEHRYIRMGENSHKIIQQYTPTKAADAIKQLLYTVMGI